MYSATLFTTLHIRISWLFVILEIKVKENYPLTDSKALRGGISIALHSLYLGARKGGWSAPRRPLYPRERPGSHCTEGCVGPTACLDLCEKSRPHRDSIPGPSSPKPVAIPTELTRRPILGITLFLT
jgi:hypothetical protein